MQRSKTVSPTTLEAAGGAQRAAAAVEAALEPLAGLTSRLDKARLRRDTIAEHWDSALAALKRRARAAEDDGAAGLYTKLFGRLVRSKKKKAAAPAPTEAPATPATAAATAGTAAA